MYTSYVIYVRQASAFPSASSPQHLTLLQLPFGQTDNEKSGAGSPILSNPSAAPANPITNDSAVHHFFL